MNATPLVIGVVQINIANAVNAAADAILQVAAKELRRQGCHGGLGDERVLREIVFRMAVRGAVEALKDRVAGREPR